jgi:signal transduction histidine kinase
MQGTGTAGNGAITPLGAHAGATAERAMLDVFLWMRLNHLVAGLVSLTVDRGRYRRPRLGDAAFACAIAESLWLVRRCLPRRRYTERAVATVDTVVGCAGLLSCAAALDPTEQFGSSNFMFPLTLFSAIAASAGFTRRREAVAAALALMTCYVVGTTSHTSGRRHRSLFGAAQYASCFIGGDILIRRNRANAVLIERIAHSAVAQAGRVAEERERRRVSADLHAGALESLEEVRSTWRTDRPRARARAGREAIRLRRALHHDGRDGGPELARRLEETIAEAGDRGLRVETILDELERDPTPERTAALTAAVRAALDNVLRHAGVVSAVVRVTNTDDGVEVSIRDRGRGSTRPGVPSSVERPVRAVGGETDWWSEPGRGARLRLRVPG